MYKNQQYATCETDGSYDVYCSFCDQYLKTETDPAYGHDFSEWYNEPEATCTEDGYQYRYCCHCSHQEDREVEALGHIEVVSEGYPATCYNDGLTDGITCARCYETLVYGENIPAGHKEGEAQIIAPTETSEGLKYIDCTECGTRLFEEKLPYVGAIGITYEVNNDNMTCVITGLGSFSGSELIIPEYIMSYRVVEIASGAFRGNKLTSVTIPAGVTKIGDNAFSSCSNLTNVTFAEGSSLSHIGNSAFRYCTCLESLVFAKPTQARASRIRLFANNSSTAGVTIPEHVSYIGEYAFGGCTSISSLLYSANATVGSEVFSGCTTLKTIVISEGVTQLGSSMFKGCSKIDTLSVASTVTSYNSAFSSTSIAKFYCNSTTSLVHLGTSSINTIVLGGTAIPANVRATNVVIGDKITSIDEAAFKNNSYIESVTISKSVKSIGVQAFSYCTKLSSITIEDGSSLTTIGQYAFYSCPITSFTVPASVTKIDSLAFHACASLQSISFENNSKLTTLGTEVFRECSALTDIVIPEGVTGSLAGVFYGCPALNTITIPFLNDKLVTLFGASTIPNSLYSVTITGGKEIPASAFEGLGKITVINLPYSLEKIGDKAFYGTSITSVYISANVTEVGNMAFACNTIKYFDVDTENSAFRVIDGNLYNKQGDKLIQYAGGKNESEFAIPSHVISVALGAFSKADNLITLTTHFIGESTDNSSNSHFGYMFGYESYTNQPVDISNVIYTGDTEIAYGAFLGCNIKSISITSNDITTICQSTFSECKKLESVTLPDSITAIQDRAFNECSALTHITLPSQLASIGYQAFYMTGLESIDIPEAVTYIGSYAFAYTSITSLQIPRNVTVIDTFAFQYCTRLTTVIIPTSVVKMLAPFEKCESINLYYEGTEERFNQIQVSPTSITGAKSTTLYFYSVDEPTTPGNYWHYVDYVPTVWP